MVREGRRVLTSTIGTPAGAGAVGVENIGGALLEHAIYDGMITTLRDGVEVVGFAKTGDREDNGKEEKGEGNLPRFGGEHVEEDLAI